MTAGICTNPSESIIFKPVYLANDSVKLVKCPRAIWFGDKSSLYSTAW